MEILWLSLEAGVFAQVHKCNLFNIQKKTLKDVYPEITGLFWLEGISEGLQLNL